MGDRSRSKPPTKGSSQGRAKRPPRRTTGGRPTRAPRRADSARAVRSLVEDSDEGMVLADAGGTILYANHAAGRLLQRDPDALVGEVGFGLVTPEHLPAAREAFGRCLAQPGDPVHASVDVTLVEGNRTLAVKLVNRLEALGVHAVAVYLRQAAAPSDKRDEPYRTLFEKALIGFGVADLEGNLLAFNDAMLQPGGYRREDILEIGNVSRLYANAGDRDRILQIAKRQGFVWREEVAFLRKDGTSYDTLLSLTPVEFKGRRCWYATVEDVTHQRRADQQRRALEAQLRQAQKMEAVGRMTGGVAHDFNNILSVILANADLIAQALPADATESRADLKELRAAASRGATMIRKLLGFSRNADLRIVPTDLGGLVEQMDGMLRHVLPEHIGLEVHTAEPTVAHCDPGVVEQMILNLATNARDAMPEGGRVRIGIETAVVGRDAAGHPSWLPSGEFVRVSVADSGVGMDESTKARALEPFFTTKAPGVGTGLGLPMVYGLMKQQRGFIDIESAVGKGTTVHLYFPTAATAARAPRQTPPPTEPRPESATILLVDDDQSLQRTGKRVLKYLGYRVFVARDGNEAVAVFRKRQSEIDLVMSDMVMPGLTGTQVYDVIHRECPTMPFLLSSGYQERPEGTLEPPPGVRVVQKPWTIEELARTIRETLEEKEDG